MSKFLITVEEWWPVYEIEQSNSQYAVEIPDDKAAWIAKVNEEFEAVQDYLNELRTTENEQ